MTPTPEIPPRAAQRRDIGAHVVLAVFVWFFGFSCQGMQKFGIAVDGPGLEASATFLRFAWIGVVVVAIRFLFGPERPVWRSAMTWVAFLIPVVLSLMQGPALCTAFFIDRDSSITRTRERAVAGWAWCEANGHFPAQRRAPFDAYFRSLGDGGLAAGLQVASARHPDLTPAEREMWCRAVVGNPCNPANSQSGVGSAGAQVLRLPATCIVHSFVSCEGTSVCRRLCADARASQVIPRDLANACAPKRKRTDGPPDLDVICP